MGEHHHGGFPSVRNPHAKQLSSRRVVLCRLHIEANRSAHLTEKLQIPVPLGEKPNFTSTNRRLAPGEAPHVSGKYRLPGGRAADVSRVGRAVNSNSRCFALDQVRQLFALRDGPLTLPNEPDRKSVE